MAKITDESIELFFVIFSNILWVKGLGALGSHSSHGFPSCDLNISI